MVKRFIASLGVIAILVSLAAPAFGIEDIATRRARKKLEAQQYPHQASEALRNNKPEEAIELFTKAIDSRAFDDQPQTLGELYYGRGNAYRMKNDCVSAIKDYDKATETLREGDLYFTRAACHLDLKQDDQALADLDTAIKIDPQAVMYRSARCILLFNRKDFANAVPDCDKAVAAQPNDPNLLTAASQANEQVGNKERAAQLYRQLLAADPGNQVATEGLQRVGT